MARHGEQLTELFRNRPKRQVERKDGRQLHRLTVYLPPELDRRLRLHCVETDTKISEALGQAVENWLLAAS